MRGGFFLWFVRGARGHTAPRASHGDRFARASRVRRASSSDALPRFGRAFSRRFAEGASTARPRASDFGEARLVGTEETSPGAMFYSQYILAKRGPLGTIWIAAHLDRRLRKQQITETDVAQAVRECPDPASRPVPADARKFHAPPSFARPRAQRTRETASRSTDLLEPFPRASPAPRVRRPRRARARPARPEGPATTILFFLPVSSFGNRWSFSPRGAGVGVGPSPAPPRSPRSPSLPSLPSQSPSSTRTPPWRSVSPASSCSASSASTAAR